LFHDKTQHLKGAFLRSRAVAASSHHHGGYCPKAAQPQPHSQVCDFFVSNIYVSRVDVADKETMIRAYKKKQIPRHRISAAPKPADMNAISE
jgi:hypothetical protein